MEIKEIIEGLMIASPMAPEDAQQAIADAIDCGEILSFAGIAEWISGNIIDDCDEWDFLPAEIWEAIGALDSAGWKALESALDIAILAELMPWEGEILGMLADERKMAPSREQARIMLAEAPARDWAALIEANEWARHAKANPSYYDRPMARLMLSIPIAWRMAPKSPSLRRALAERLASEQELCILL